MGGIEKMQSQPPSAEYRQTVENEVSTFIENLRQFSIIIEDFKDDSQEPFQHKIEELVGNLMNIEKLGTSFNVEVPMGVLNCIDEGKNPDLYTKQSLEECYRSQQQTDGKKQSLSVGFIYFLLFFLKLIDWKL